MKKVTFGYIVGTAAVANLDTNKEFIVEKIIK